MERVVITSANIDRICNDIAAADQESEVRIGREISTWPITYGNGQRGQMTVFHDVNRAAVAFGGPSIWGDWDDVTRTLRDEDGTEYDENGEPVEVDDEGEGEGDGDE